MNLKRIFGIFAVMIVVCLGGAYVYFLHYSPPAMPTDLQGSVHSITIEHDGLSRTSDVYVPQKVPTRSRALVLVFHGSQGTSAQARSGYAYSWDRLADQHGFIVAYPQGFEKHWNDCRKMGDYSANHQNVDDTGFMAVLIDQLADEYGVSRRAVYATGISNGGQMAFRLALEEPTMVSGIAAVAAAMPDIDNLDCHTTGIAENVMIINGTADPLVPPQGGDQQVFGQSRGRVLSMKDSAEYWVELARHAYEGYVDTDLEDVDPTDGSTITKREWRYGGGKTVVLLRVNGGGHTIPNREFDFPRVLGNTNRDVDSASIMWDFFTQ